MTWGVDMNTTQLPIGSMPLERCNALILNADFRPLSYFPLSVWSWQDAVKAIFRGTVHILSEYDRSVRSPDFEMQLPSVLALKDYIAPKRHPAFTRFNVYLRDSWNCQYCGQGFETQALTFDHVIPRSKGGRTCWENIVAACRPCNARKSNNMPHDIGMHPLIKPQQPTLYDLQRRGQKFPPNFLHESWSDYLYWDSELEDA